MSISSNLKYSNQVCPRSTYINFIKYGNNYELYVFLALFFVVQLSPTMYICTNASTNLKYLIIHLVVIIFLTTNTTDHLSFSDKFDNPFIQITQDIISLYRLLEIILNIFNAHWIVVWNFTLNT